MVDLKKITRAPAMTAPPRCRRHAAREVDLRVTTYGTVDELNACIGMARLHTAEMAELDAHAGRHPERPLRPQVPISPRSKPPRRQRWTRCASPPLRSTGWNATSTALTPRWRRCVPSCCRGGSAAAAALHLARTMARRAERLVVELSRRPGESVGEEAMKYVKTDCQISCSWRRAPPMTMKRARRVMGARQEQVARPDRGAA